MKCGNINSKVCTYLIVFVSITSKSHCARILAFFPMPSISHQVVFRPIIQELLKRGHEMVVITTDPAFPEGQSPENLTEVDTGEISYEIWQDGLVSFVTGEADRLRQCELFSEVSIKVVLKQIEHDKVKAILRNKHKKFDLLLLESDLGLTLSLTHIFKIPAIQISSMSTIRRQFDTVGAPNNAFIYPTLYRTKLQNLTFTETLLDGYLQHRIDKLVSIRGQKENELLKDIFGPDTPTTHDLKQHVAMVFSNISPLWEGIRPVPQTMLYMGGLHQSPAKDLPQDLKSYLDSSVNGVIYFSLGTNVNLAGVSREKVQMFVNVLSHLPYDVLWKWNNDEGPTDAKNIKFVKWIPQGDMLRHPKVKLFITQGGLQSTDEAIEAGVPLIGIPMIYDQYYNVEKYLYFGIGLRLDLESITEDKLRNAINTVIENDSFRRNLLKLRSQIRDQPQTSLSRAIWWIEYVLRHGGTQHLRSPAANMPWTEKLEVYLILSLIFELFIYTTVILFTLYYMFKRLFAYVRSYFVLVV